MKKIIIALVLLAQPLLASSVDNTLTLHVEGSMHYYTIYCPNSIYLQRINSYIKKSGGKFSDIYYTNGGLISIIVQMPDNSTHAMGIQPGAACTIES